MSAGSPAGPSQVHCLTWRALLAGTHRAPDSGCSPARHVILGFGVPGVGGSGSPGPSSVLWVHISCGSSWALRLLKWPLGLVPQEGFSLCRHVVPWDLAAVPWPRHPNQVPSVHRRARWPQGLHPGSLCGCVRRGPALSLGGACHAVSVASDASQAGGRGHAGT